MRATPLNSTAFEGVLTELCRSLTARCATEGAYRSSEEFESGVRGALQTLLSGYGKAVDFAPHPYIFPDVVIGEWGIEVKFSSKDTWRSVANSIFESFRSHSVKSIYLLFGKMGGVPEVRWEKYDDCVIHVRTSHLPRFEVEMSGDGGRNRGSLFETFGITYKEFSELTLHDRMEYVRNYARQRLKPGERLWWLEDQADTPHTLPLQAKLYTSLSDAEKRRMRAEASILCPQITSSSRSRHKYDDPVLYLLTYRGVLCHQARDLFSAGSVAGKARGGNYLLRALQDLEPEMREAAATLDDQLFVEYWGESVQPEQRIHQWLIRADSYARSWKPSEELFLSGH